MPIKSLAGFPVPENRASSARPRTP